MASGTEDITGSFSFDVTKRILEALETSGPMKKTNLATKTGLNYNVCLRYIKMLKLLEWIEVSSDKWDYVSITEVGRQVNGKLLSPSAVVNASVPDAKNKQAEEEGRGGFQFQQRPPQSSGRSLSEKAAVRSDDRADTAHEFRSIMLVDDEPDILVTYQSFLSLEGYSVGAFLDAYSALRDFAARPTYYDLVILDIRMPDLNGLQIYQSLKAMNPSCKVIFITALDAAKEMISILPGVTSEDIMKKPIDKEVFLKKVRHILSKNSVGTRAE
ncbi:response regulator with CheY-like receiver, AAA-type ATPase, and DNA-binding domains [Candidatus Nitrososphaera evergladensis SR1]|uniref:Response regulator with CheY-like receiver, AAA-type ATPase, and DNA-binding domains n=1 Tax=Candidatus Nitrososphaera evergladensis SR1 TaxID=1459636 RepID=A0A075MRW0_9ARCH|nr:response regulator [Candidatus Nitrososphaera evergladensis]AIF83557.1 response regulator with CheY-like receiver, AAA-type ATPase, and DNA-binding domains [Candidatus Nitrososphaera evergladensis SR1]